MDNVIIIRSPAEIAAEINAIRRRAARQLLEDSVEVGRLLCEAKNAVQHGEWGGWLEENFQYSSTEANNLMRLYEAYGTKEQVGLFEEDRTAIFGRLNKSQAIALLGIPEPERAAFVEQNPPEDISVREWEARISEAREQGRKDAWENWREDFEETKSNLRAEVKRADDAVSQALAEQLKRENAEKAAKEAIDKLADADKRANEAEELAAEAKKLKKDLKDAQKNTRELTDLRAKDEAERLALMKEKEALRAKIGELENAPPREMTDTERAAVEEKVRAEISGETDALRAEIEKLRLAADPGMQAFQRYFDNFRSAYAEMKTLIAGADEEKQKRLAGALRKVLGAMSEEWR